MAFHIKRLLASVNLIVAFGAKRLQKGKWIVPWHPASDISIVVNTKGDFGVTFAACLTCVFVVLKAFFPFFEPSVI